MSYKGALRFPPRPAVDVLKLQFENVNSGVSGDFKGEPELQWNVFADYKIKTQNNVQESVKVFKLPLCGQKLFKFKISY